MRKKKSLFSLLFVSASVKAYDTIPLYPQDNISLLFLCFTLCLGVISFLGTSYYLNKIDHKNQRLKDELTKKNQLLRQQKQRMYVDNKQLKKKLEVRSQYMHTVVNQARLTSNKPLKSVLSSELQEIKLQLNQSFESLLALEQECCESNTIVKVNLSSLMAAVVSAWESEFDAIDASIELINDTSLTYVETKCFNLDDLFNRLLGNIYQCAHQGQKIQVYLRQNNERMAVCFVDNSWGLADKDNSLEKTHFSSPESLETINLLVEMSGGKVYCLSTEHLNEIVITWRACDQKAKDECMLLSFDSTMTSQCKQKAKQEKNNEWLDKVYRLVEDNYSEPDFATCAAAKHLYVSERSMQRKFKTITGKTFTEHLTDVRLRKACQMLKEGGKISDVALSSGFNDASYFSQKFRCKYGVPPSKYQKTL